MFGRKHPEVLVIGAGPVGLFAALVLTRKGVRVRIVDKELRTAAHSYALALHPATLQLLAETGIAGDVLLQAYRVDRIGFYDGPDRVAETPIGDASEYVAVLPQEQLENALEDALAGAGVRVQWNHRAVGIGTDESRAVSRVEELEMDSLGYAVAHSEWIVARERSVHASYIIGADGYESEVRRSLDIAFPEVGPAQYFAVFEFETDYDAGGEMRVVFHGDTANVLWPLPRNRCRWSFELPGYAVNPGARRKERLAYTVGAYRFPVLGEDALQAFLRERAPWFNARIGDMDWRMVVRFERRLADGFGDGAIYLAGDAAHLTGPVGVQSMNIGMREAFDLAGALAAGGKEHYEKERLDRYASSRMDEWRFMLGQEGGLQPAHDAPPALASRADLLLSCLPASGSALDRMAERLGFRVVR